MKYSKPLILLGVVTLVLCAVYFLLIARTSRTVDFFGTVNSVRVSGESGSVYVTATQETNSFTCEIEIKKHTVCKDANGETINPTELKADDRISVNFRSEPKLENGINKAVALSPIKVYPHATNAE